MSIERDTAIFAEMSKPQRAALFRSRLAPDGDCLVWTMAKNPRGYGLFRIGVDGRTFTCSAHRVAWMLANGRAIPDGHEVDHLCRNPACCRGEHLEAVVRRENVARIHGRSLTTQSPVVSSGRGSIHRRRRVNGDRFLVTWRDVLEDGSRIQRGKSFGSLEEAQSFVDRSTDYPSEQV